jgi:hypothetical protein
VFYNDVFSQIVLKRRKKAQGEAKQISERRSMLAWAAAVNTLRRFSWKEYLRARCWRQPEPLASLKHESGIWLHLPIA